MFYIVLFAMIAAFLGLMLFRVLGKHSEHEQPILPRAADDGSRPRAQPRVIEAMAEPRDAARSAGPASAGLRAISAADANFDAVAFVEGAKAAYKMILEAFWKGDAETIEWLTDPPVTGEFQDAIAARKKAKQTLENRLVVIEKAAITDAVVEGGVARLSVRFVADIVAATRDAKGKLISGSLTDATETKEIWTFARTLKSDDPNWKLVETDEA